MENKSGYLENDPFFDCQPVKCFEQWSELFMSALAQNNPRCMSLNFLQPVYLITVNVNEQRVATVSLPENKLKNTSAGQWLSSSGDGG